MAAADEKILTSIKAPLGYPEEYDSFDFELLMHINSIVGTLQQLGVGPVEGLSVDKDTPWSALLVDDATHKLEGAKSYMFLRVKMLFDSNNMPAHLISAYEKMIQEAEWRLTIASDPRIPIDDLLTQEDLQEHIDSPTPHPEYDDMVDLTLEFENRLI